LKGIIKNAYDDALLEMKKVIPKKIQDAFIKNKKKFLLILLIPIFIEVLIISGVYEIIFR